MIADTARKIIEPFVEAMRKLAAKPKPPQAPPEAYRKPKRIPDGFAFREDAAAAARERLLSPPKDDGHPDGGGGTPAPGASSRPAVGGDGGPKIK